MRVNLFSILCTYLELIHHTITSWLCLSLDSSIFEILLMRIKHHFMLFKFSLAFLIDKTSILSCFHIFFTCCYFYICTSDQIWYVLMLFHCLLCGHMFHCTCKFLCGLVPFNRFMIWIMYFSIFCLVPKFVL